MPDFVKKKRVYVHIGGEKTGTKTLQTFLHMNADLLKALGILYPNDEKRAYFEGGGHFPLAASLVPDGNAIDFISSWKRGLLASAADQLVYDLNESQEETVILSCEHFSSRATDYAKLTQFKKRLLEITEDVKIVCYLREQSSLALAAFSTAIRSGSRDAFDPDAITPDNPYFNQLLLLDFWASVFGPENIIAREYDTRTLVNGEICEDFCEAVNIPFSSEFVLPPRKNESLDALTLEGLRHINQLMVMAAEDIEVYLVHNQLRNDVLLPRLEKSPHYKLYLSPSDRSRILDRFKVANEELNIRYMGGSLSRDWFGLHNQSDNGKSVYGKEAISAADLNRKLSEIAFAFAMELQAAQSGLQVAQAEARTAQLELQAAQIELQNGRSELQVAQSELHRVYRTKVWRMRKSIMGYRDRIRHSIFHKE